MLFENNRVFSMTTDNNENVVIDVSKIDSTVDFDHRQILLPINRCNRKLLY
jgi:hypothetical protein